MGCPSIKVIKSDSKRFCRYRKVTRRQVMRPFTRNGNDPRQNGSSNLLTPYRKQPDRVGLLSPIWFVLVLSTLPDIESKRINSDCCRLFGLFRLRLSCGHDWICSGSVNVKYTTKTTHGQRSQQNNGKNHAPIIFDRQDQVYQGHMSCRNNKKCNTNTLPKYRFFEY